MTFENDFQKILDNYRANSEAMQSNSYWSTPSYNVGDDVESAIDFVESLLEDFQPKGNGLADDQRFAQLIETNIELFESLHRDPDGFGVGTLREIINQLNNTEALT